MKALKTILVLLVAITLLSCDKNNTNPTPENKAPTGFNLIAVANGSTDVYPTLSWTAATDPDGDTVNYDVYLNATNDSNPTELIAENLTETSFSIENRLEVLTNYAWKVIAKDNHGGSTSSAIYTFKTRKLSDGKLMVENAEFNPRRLHKTIVFKNELWLFGGRTVNGFQNDIWKSSDGLTWQNITNDAEFGKLNGFSISIFKDKIQIIGGKDSNGNYTNTIWTSTDGLHWVKISTPPEFEGRHLHTSLIYNDKLWVIGGYNGTIRKNDVWFSEDGITWQMATANANFSPREEHAATVFDGKMWIIGGNDGINKNDVWSSTNGIDWNLVTENAAFSARQQHTVNTFDHKMWLIAGTNTNNEVWYSNDGVIWSASTLEANFPKRSLHTTTVFNNKLWVIGGDGSSLKNDVWYLD